MIIHIIAGLTEKILLHKINQFPEPYAHSKRKIDCFSDFATKFGVDISKFAEKADLASLKLDIIKLDIDELKTTPNYSKLNDVVKSKVVKKIVYHELVKKVNTIDTSGLAKRTKNDGNISDTENKISSITGLATTAALNVVDNKIPKR